MALLHVADQPGGMLPARSLTAGCPITKRRACVCAIQVRSPQDTAHRRHTARSSATRHPAGRQRPECRRPRWILAWAPSVCRRARRRRHRRPRGRLRSRPAQAGPPHRARPDAETYLADETPSPTPSLARLVVGASWCWHPHAHVVTRAMVERMKPGSAIIDVSIDQGGSVETSRPTTLAEPPSSTTA